MGQRKQWLRPLSCTWRQSWQLSKFHHNQVGLLRTVKGGPKDPNPPKQKTLFSLIILLVLTRWNILNWYSQAMEFWVIGQIQSSVLAINKINSALLIVAVIVLGAKKGIFIRVLFKCFTQLSTQNTRLKVLYMPS